MNLMILSVGFAALLFAGVLACMRLGWSLGRKREAMHGGSGQTGWGAIEGAVFGLMGLLIAFTFTGAAARFDQRRSLITEQVNAIGTAWLRLDLLPEPDRESARDGFRRYLDTQMEVVRQPHDPAALHAGLVRLAAVQQEIWTTLMRAVKSETSLPLAQMLLPPANEVFDLTTTRLLTARQHPPLAVYLMLAMLVLMSALMAGYGMAKSERLSTLHLVGFAAILSFSVYLILDIEHPRLGIVTIESFDQAIVDLRKSMD